MFVSSNTFNQTAVRFAEFPAFCLQLLISSLSQKSQRLCHFKEFCLLQINTLYYVLNPSPPIGLSAEYWSLSPTFTPHGTDSVLHFCISEPTFVSSSLDPAEGKLYFFFSEVGKEFSYVDDLKTARVAQVCKVTANSESARCECAY